MRQRGRNYLARLGFINLKIVFISPYEPLPQDHDHVRNRIESTCIDKERLLTPPGTATALGAHRDFRNRLVERAESQPRSAKKVAELVYGRGIILEAVFALRVTAIAAAICALRAARGAAAAAVAALLGAFEGGLRGAPEAIIVCGGRFAEAQEAKHLGERARGSSRLGGGRVGFRARRLANREVLAG